MKPDGKIARLLLILALMGYSLLLAGCSSIQVGGGAGTAVSGNTTTQDRPVKDFSRVSLAGIGDLTLTQGNTESLKIEADENILSLIETQVKDGILYISIKPPSGQQTFQATRPIKYSLSIIKVNGLEIAGSGNIQADKIQTDTLDLGISGSGNIRIGILDGKSLKADLSGSGGMELSGKTQEQTIDIGGSGSYQAAKLESQETNVSITGSGSAVVWASGTLNIDLTGSGSVDYYGQPQLSENITGPGSVNAKGNP